MIKFCCRDMRGHIEYKCDCHDNAFDCYDHLLYYSEVFDEYGIIVHDGGTSYIRISHCPFCGQKLPISKRDLYFEVLEKLGYDSPLSQNVPPEFQTDEWWKKRGL